MPEAVPATTGPGSPAAAPPPGPALFSLAGQVALVTGASRGIGAAAATAMAAAGADVVLVARSEKHLDDVAATARGYGRRALVLTADVTQADDIERVCETALAEYGRIDTLVNNAGGPIFQSAVADIRDEGWHRIIELNLTSAFRFCRHLGPTMVARGSGSIVNIASVAAVRPWPAIAAYGAAKSALVNITQSLAVEWGPHGVRANAISPAWIATAINQAYLADETLTEEAMNLVTLGRWGTPEDVAGAVVWFASPASAFVTGQHLVIDGGASVGNMPRDSMTTLNRIP